MMNNTYSLVINQSERAWSFQWARTLIALERRVAQSDLNEHQRRYSINIASKEQSNTDKQSGNQETTGSGSQRQASKFVPALMIIKRMSFTRAERRRLVLTYWQVSIFKQLDTF